MAFRSLRAVTGPLRVLAASRSAVVRAAPRLSTSLAPRVAIGAARAFSLTPRALGSGETDVSLAGALEAEIQYEKESGVDSVPEFVKVFTKDGVWKIEDSQGHDEVTLKRSFGNETIQVVFSIADIDTPQESELTEGEEAEEEASGSYPVRCSVTISKPKSIPGSLAIDTLAQEGAFVIENIAFYPDASLATDLTAEADWKRRGLYIGPQFDHLDVGVQEEFEKFLEERGINSSVALFVPEYAAHKEQREYMKWLENVKAFIDV